MTIKSALQQLNFKLDNNIAEQTDSEVKA